MNSPASPACNLRHSLEIAAPAIKAGAMDMLTEDADVRKVAVPCGAGGVGEGGEVVSCGARTAAAEVEADAAETGRLAWGGWW